MARIQTSEGREKPIYASLSLILLACLFAANIYKAWTLGITIDEAFTYLNYVSGPFSAVFTEPGYNNHALNTLLCKLSVAVFGLSEFTLRLPSVLCGFNLGQRCAKDGAVAQLTQGSKRRSCYMPAPLFDSVLHPVDALC